MKFFHEELWTQFFLSIGTHPPLPLLPLDELCVVQETAGSGAAPSIWAQDSRQEKEEEGGKIGVVHAQHLCLSGSGSAPV